MKKGLDISGVCVIIAYVSNTHNNNTKGQPTMNHTEHTAHDLKHKFLPLHGCENSLQTFADNGRVKAVFVHKPDAEFYLHTTFVSEASRGQGYNVKYRPTAEQVVWLTAENTVRRYNLHIVDLGLTVKEYVRQYEIWKLSHKGNFGNFTEDFMCERFNGEKNTCYNACFTDNTSDIRIGEKWYQVKNGVKSAATIYCEKTLNRQWELKFPK